MNSVSSGLGSGIGFGIGNRLFGGSSVAASAPSGQPQGHQQHQQHQQHRQDQQEQPLHASTLADACNQMKMRLFAIKEARIMYRDDQDRYNRLFEEYEKLCTHRTN